MSNKIQDISGNKFGRLTVISLSHSDKKGTFWKCVCDCGNSKVVSRSNLVSGNTVSCGCQRIEKARNRLLGHTPPNKSSMDMIGKRFGSLVVVSFVGVHKHRSRWSCLCDCGNTTETTTNQLTTMGTTSCGCTRRENLVGKRFGQLVVQKYVYTKKTKAYWSCLCDCGATIITSANMLKVGDKTSCGTDGHVIGKSIYCAGCGIEKTSDTTRFQKAKGMYSHLCRCCEREYHNKYTKTMRSRLYENLYITGDLLDINRPSGGYSLQLCWTTGFVAGNN